MARTDTRRLFFALWPDEVLRVGLVERREQLGPVSRRRVPDHNLHLTLVFLGDQPADRLPRIEAAAGQVRGRACELVLDRFGWFPGARVLWLGGEPPAALAACRRDLAARLERSGLTFDRRPFCPHVTLFRQVSPRPAQPQPPPMRWPVRDFSLIESIPGRPYQVLRTWSLDWEIP